MADRRKLVPGDKSRAPIEEAVVAGLGALRAAGLEPSDYAKELAVQVAGGEITTDEMEAALAEHHGLPAKLSRKT
jgi:hypothetical protein